MCPLPPPESSQPGPVEVPLAPDDDLVVEQEQAELEPEPPEGSDERSDKR